MRSFHCNSDLRQFVAAVGAAGLVFFLLLSPGVLSVAAVGLHAGATAGQAGEDREEALKRLVVMIRATIDGEEEIGAGLIVGRSSDRLYVITANHVVRRGLVAAENVRVLLRWLPGEWTPAVLLDHRDTALDIAVLAIPGIGSLAVPELDWRALAAPDSLSPRQDIFPIGYPSGEAWFVSPAPFRLSRVDGQYVFIQSGLTRGYSGGVLVTEGWNIVGIAGRDGDPTARASRIDRAIERLNEWGYPIETTFREPATTEEAAARRACEITGLVFDEDANEPLSAVNLGLRASMEDGRGRTLVQTIATTGPDGRFGFTCPADAEPEDFPLWIELWHPNWVATHITAVRFGYGDRQTDVNIPIRMSRVDLKRPPYEPRPPLQPSSIGDVVIIPTRGRSLSYDFRTKRLGDGPTGGDFYFSGEYPGFYANNQGQQGILDLGEADRPLDQIPRPASGYSQFGVNAVIGHVYVALASVEGDSIAFRVLDIGYADGRTQHYRIEYVYREREPVAERPTRRDPVLTIPRAAALTYRTGEIEIPQTYQADLDEGVLASDASVDIWFQARNATERYITPRNGALLGVAGRRSVGRDGCAALNLSTQSISLAELPVGTFVCVRTSEGRFSEFRLQAPVGARPGRLRIAFTTWEP